MKNSPDRLSRPGKTKKTLVRLGGWMTPVFIAGKPRCPPLEYPKKSFPPC
jgi:hypothetical protein